MLKSCNNKDPIPHAIKKDEKLTAITNGFGIPLVVSLHLWVSSPWIPAIIACVGMNLAYIEASIKVLMATSTDDDKKKDDDNKKTKKDNHGHKYLQTELLASLVMIGMGVYGYINERPIWLIVAIALHGPWDFVKHTCGCGVPFFGWYLSGCGIFDIVYASVLYYVYY